MSVLDLGDVYNAAAGCEIFVYDDTGTLAAATVVLTITLPDGTTTTPAVTTPSTGRYQASYKPTLTGTHYVRWVATSVGGVSGADTAEESTFTVSESSNAFISLDEARSHLNLQSTVTDDELASFIEWACELAQEVADTQFARKTVVDVLNGNCARSLSLTRRPVLSVSSVTENGVALVATTGYTTDLRWGRLYRQTGTYYDSAWYEGRRNVSVTYVAGYQIIPPQVRFATLVILEHLWTTQRGAAPSGRPSVDDQYSTPSGNWFIPNRARDILLDYRPPSVA